MLANIYASEEHGLQSRKCFFWSKLGENLLEMEVRTSARIKKVVFSEQSHFAFKKRHFQGCILLLR